MRVLHVISSLDPSAGGTTTALHGLAAAQVKVGLTVSVLATHNPDEPLSVATALSAAGVAVGRVGPARGRLKRAPGLAAAVNAAVAACDVVHIHALWEEIQHQAARAARRRRIPYVMCPHGMLDPWSLRQSRWIKRAALAWRVGKNLNMASALHFTADEERDLTAPLGLRAAAIVEPNGVDLDEFAALPPPDTFRQRYPQIADRPMVLFLARLHPKKGLDLLIPAFAQAMELRHSGASAGTGWPPDAVLVLAGPDADGYRATVEAMVRRHGLSDRVIFTGMLQGEQRIAALADADLFALPSYQENFGISVVEALAAGTPVIISDQVNIHRQIAAAGVGGVVPLNVGPLADALLHWLDDAELRRSAAARAPGFVRDHFDWNAIARRWQGHYQRLIADADLKGTADTSKQTAGLIPAKPLVAIVCNSLPPYRLHVHQRISSEIPQIRLRTVMTHERDGRWQFVAPPEVGLASFGIGESCWNQGRPRYALHEWKKAGRIIRWARKENLAAMVLLGYNDAGRLRLIRWCRRHGKPCFVWGDSNIRDESVRGLKAATKTLVVRRVLSWVTGVLTCGRLGREYFAKYGVPGDHMFPFPVEPDYDQIQNLPPERIKEARRKFALAEGRRRMVFSGRLSPEKRVDLLFDAFAAIAADRPEWDLCIAGDGELRSRLKARVPNDLQGRIIWLGHVSDPDTLFGIYRASDLLVLPSDREPWALVINEAVAAGMAVVSSDVPGAAAELVRDGENGRIFPAGDMAALRDCLLDVTRAEKIDALKARSAAVLADWRREGDPIQGLRHALRWAHVLPEP